MLEDERLDLDIVDSLDAQVFGEPGKRTFRITARSSRGEAIIWMEKEQLFQIGIAIKQVAAAVDRPDILAPHEPEFPAPPVPGTAEFKASELRIRHDGTEDVFTIEAANPESEAEGDDEEPAIAVQFSFPREMGETLADQALAAVAGGRPRCQLCGGPIDPEGHVCPKTNGHFRGEIGPA